MCIRDSLYTLQASRHTPRGRRQAPLQSTRPARAGVGGGWCWTWAGWRSVRWTWAGWRSVRWTWA
eukprot:2632055-Rhodomonas_salina.1